MARIFHLIKTIEGVRPWSGAPEVTAYRYAEDVSEATFYLHPFQSMTIGVIDGDNALCEELGWAFMFKGLHQHELGGFDKAIATLEIEAA